MNRFLATLGLALALGLPLATGAQQYPSRPIRAVVAFGTGGATDVIARLTLARVSFKASFAEPHSPR